MTEKDDDASVPDDNVEARDEEFWEPVEEEELPPEQREALRQAKARLRSGVNPRVTSMVNGLQQNSGIGRVLRDMDKWKRIGLADSVAGRALRQAALGKTGLGKSVLGTNFPTSKTLLSGFKFEPTWAKQMRFINSDVYNMRGAGQGNLIALNSVLARNAEFGFGKTTPSWIGQFAKQQNSWLKTLPSFKFNIYPANLKGIDGLRLEDVEEVVLIDGIALYGVPRTEIAEKLVNADSTTARREILGRRWKAVSADCREVLEGCTSSSMAGYVPFAIAALDALDGDNPQAAQALESPRRVRRLSSLRLQRVLEPGGESSALARPRRV